MSPMTDQDWADHYWELAGQHVGNVARQDVYDAIPTALKREVGTFRQTTLFEAVEGLLERPLIEEERAILWERYNKTYDYWALVRIGKKPDIWSRDR